MRGVLREFQEETGHLYNLEATPAESTAYRLARLDRQKYPRIYTSGTEKHPYLTNSTQLNVDATRDIFEAIQHQGEIQPLYTGGTIFHAFLPEAIDGETCKKLVQRIAQTKLPYFSITPTFSVCMNHGYIRGRHPSARTAATRPRSTAASSATCGRSGPGTTASSRSSRTGRPTTRSAEPRPD